ncbi:MAG TPA: ATP-binding cassette domain-containing protein [Jiangellaceae bacterium]|nr:ATP-binding cassette domain-containing protein [Jiangellaceae bacterium]
MARQQRTFEVLPDGDVSGMAIDLAGLHKSYGSIEAVAGVNLRVARGEVVAILGPNGAGKSTTIDMLLGLTRPDSGTVRLFGRRPERAVAAGAVGAMLQTGGLIQNISVEELITLMASLYPNPMAVADVLERTGLTDVGGNAALVAWDIARPCAPAPVGRHHAEYLARAIVNHAPVCRGSPGLSRHSRQTCRSQRGPGYGLPQPSAPHRRKDPRYMCLSREKASATRVRH